MSFVERVGGVLTAPRATLEAALDGPLGRGTRDVGVLLALRVIAGETPRLWRAVETFAGSPRMALVRVMAATAQVLPDLIGILIGSVLLSLFVERGRGRDRSLDLAAYAWVPYLAVQLAGALAFSALGRAPSRAAEYALSGVALAWSVAVWGLGVAIGRRPRPSPLLRGGDV